MHEAIEQHLPALQRLRERYGVEYLTLFGSGARSDISPERRDIDRLATFKDMEPAQQADAYFGVKEDLEALLQREVDLVTECSISNPHFRPEIERGNTVVYAA